MGKEKVITVMCASRLPEMLVKRIDAAAESGGVSRAQFIAEACRMRLDGLSGSGSSERECDGSSSVGRASGLETLKVAGSNPDLPHAPSQTMQALREICAGKVHPDDTLARMGAAGHGSGLVDPAEVPICGKDWWEDGEQYECLMDKGHKEQKHGLRGMVRRLDP